MRRLALLDRRTSRRLEREFRLGHQCGSATCWAAVGSAVRRFYARPISQCRLIEQTLRLSGTCCRSPSGGDPSNCCRQLTLRGTCDSAVTIPEGLGPHCGERYDVPTPPTSAVVANVVALLTVELEAQRPVVVRTMRGPRGPHTVVVVEIRNEAPSLYEVQILDPDCRDGDRLARLDVELWSWMNVFRTKE